MIDEYETFAGPYVLGALSPAERQAFEGHLSTCAGCRAAVARLAGLPGLLARVPAEVVATADEGPVAGPVPATLLPALLRQVRRRRARVRVLVGAVAVAAATLLIAAVGITLHDPAQAPTPSVAGQPMRAVVDTPLTAEVALQPVAWGTKVALRCRYDTDSGGRLPYALVVVDDAGHTEMIGSWTAVPGRDSIFTGATRTKVADIASVQIRTFDGRQILTTSAS